MPQKIKWENHENKKNQNDGFEKSHISVIIVA